MQKNNIDLDEIGTDVVKSTAVLEAQTNEVAEALDKFADHHETLGGWITSIFKTLIMILK